MTMSSAAQNSVDFDALLDLSEYDNHHNSPSLSPAPASKATFASPISPSMPTPSICSSTSQTLSGPSHNYDMYRQQTGFVPGAIANTMAVNQTYNAGYQDFGSLDYIPTVTPETDLFDFNTSPSQGATDLSFESPTETQHLFNTVNPNSMEQDASPRIASPLVSTSGSVGRLWPGAHSQAAFVKAQAQQRQQQQQQQQQPRTPRPGPRQSRGKASQPCDPIVEQKISQLLNSMRAKASASEPHNPALQANLPRTRKEEDDMDEDERLLASEEGKKLSSKERRQLRNKVSARAFRSRRKEYISQLEAEIAAKVNENGDLRAENRALLDENKRLSDLTRMLLSSSSFSNFLDHLSSNPSAAPPVRAEAQQQAPDQNQVPKDANPYRGQHSQQQQIGMAMIPEQSMDVSMLHLDGINAYNFQPQVFVVETPEIATALVAPLLSGKARDFGDETFQPDEDGKMDVSVIERRAEYRPTSVASSPAAPVDEKFESDPDFALFHSEPATRRPAPTRVDADGPSSVDMDDHPDADKVATRHDPVNAAEEDVLAIIAMARVRRLSANMESVVSRLELLTMDLRVDNARTRVI